jgi:CHAT domain-containing protein
MEEASLRTQYSALVQAALRGDQNEAVAEGLKAIMAKTSHPELSCQCAMMLSTIYSAQSDWDAAMVWARKAFDQVGSREDDDLAWTAAKALTIAWRDQLVFSKRCPLGDFEDFASFVASWTDKTGERQHIDDQIEMFGIAAQVEAEKCKQIFGLDLKESSQKSLSWLAKATSLLELLADERERLAALADIQFRSASAYSGADDFATAASCLQLAETIFSQLEMERQATKARVQRSRMSLLWIYEGYRGRAVPPDDIETMLNTVMNDLDTVQENLVESGMRFQLVKCHYQKALVWEHAHRLGQAEALHQALEELMAAEELLNQIRGGMTLQKDEEMLKHKADFVGRSAEIHELGIQVSLKLDCPGDAWEWTQKGKARAFLDLTSFNEPIPRSFLEAARVNTRAQELLDEEAELRRRCEQAPPQDRFPIRQKLVTCRGSMSHVEELHDICLFRGMRSLKKNQLKAMFPSRDDVVCVDWVTLQGDIYMFTVRPGYYPEVAKLSMSIEAVSLWIRSNLKAEYLRQPRANQRLRELDKLVEPLSTKSNPGDLLIFCPGGILASLPLHALYIDQQLLIERNTIIYTPSLAILHHCLFRRSEDAVRLNKSAVFGNPSCDRAAAETSSRSIAQSLGVTPYIGKDATKASFMTATQTSDMALYHGHAMFNASDPLGSALVLNQGDNLQDSTRYLTAREILQTHLKLALFIMIACESAMQEVTPGEEPTGLLPMFVLAGVNSAIGTLWKCSDIAGKMFTNELFSTVLKSNTMPRSDAGPVLFEVAKAVQMAALELRKQKPEPYFWAAFVLYGRWECWITE